MPRNTRFRILTVLLVLLAGTAASATAWHCRHSTPAAYTSIPDEHPLFESGRDGMSVRKNLEEVRLRAFTRPHALPVLEEPWDHAESITKQVRYRCSTNSLGFRGQELEPERQDGVARVAFVGDSIVFGHGVDDADTLTAQLGVLLAEHGRFELVNAGVPANRSWDAVAILQRRVLPLKPDAVFLAVASNDIVHVIEGTWRQGGRSFSLTESELTSVLAQYHRQLTVFVRICEDRGVAVELLVPPTSTFYPFPDYQRLVAEVHRVGQEQDVPVYDLQPVLRQAEERNGLVLADLGDQQQLVRFHSGVPEVLLTANVALERPYYVADEIYEFLEEEPVSQYTMLDGSHPNARGHRLLAEALVPEVLALLEGTGE